MARLPHRSHRRNRLRQEHGRQSVRGARRHHRRHGFAGARGGRARLAAARRDRRRISARRCCRRTAAWIAPPCASGCSPIPLKDSGWSSSRIRRFATLTDARCEAATGPYVMVAIPLLVETRGADRFDRVLVVDCEPELQLARLQARDGMTREQAQRMLAAQVTREQRLAVADDVILNNGDIANLRDQVEKLHRQYSCLTFAIGPDRHMSADEHDAGSDRFTGAAAVAQNSPMAEEAQQHAGARGGSRAAGIRAAAQRADAHLPAPRLPLQPGAVPQRDAEPVGQPRRHGQPARHPRHRRARRRARRRAEGARAPSRAAQRVPEQARRRLRPPAHRDEQSVTPARRPRGLRV